MRRGSATFGHWVGTELSAAAHQPAVDSAGFAHGFLVAERERDFLYKTTDYYAPAAEGSVRWDDPRLAIEWPDPGVPIRLSDKDRSAPSFALAPSFE